MCSLNSLRSYVSWHISFGHAAHNFIFRQLLQELATEIIFLNSNRDLFLSVKMNSSLIAVEKKKKQTCLNQMISSCKLDIGASGNHHVMRMFFKKLHIVMKITAILFIWINNSY